MVAGSRQKGNKTNKESKDKIIGVELKNNNPMMPIDKVKTVIKPDCNKAVHAKTVTVRKAAVRLGNVGKETTSYMLGDGTEIVNFQTRSVNAKVGKASMLRGDGTEKFDCLIKEDK